MVRGDFMHPRRLKPAERKVKRQKAKRHSGHPAEIEGAIKVDPTRLAPSGSWDEPEFQTRGYYEDAPFTCRDCGKEEVWTASQQKWWYEVAKGNPFTVASRCRN